jgi:hypothetical protein
MEKNLKNTIPLAMLSLSLLAPNGLEAGLTQAYFSAEEEICNQGLPIEKINNQKLKILEGAGIIICDYEWRNQSIQKLSNKVWKEFHEL